MVGVWKEGMLCAHQFTLPLCPSSESGPEPCPPGSHLSVLPAFQPLYPPNHGESQDLAHFSLWLFSFPLASHLLTSSPFYR